MPQYFSQIYGPRLQGKCLNVGLGDGDSARVMLSLRGITQVVSLEKDASVITAYQTRWIGDPAETRHTPIQVNINTLGTVLNATKPYNYILVDTIENLTEVPYNILRTFLTQVKTDAILAPTGVVQIMYQADVPSEREFKVHWMETNFVRIVEPVIGFREPRTYYRLP